MRDKETQIQRSYEGIKSEILSGAFRPGERLESHQFEMRYNTSSTSVRMALSRLAGERLIEATALDGFHIPMISEGWLYELYITTHILLRGCLTLLATASPDLSQDVAASADLVATTEGLFNAIAAGTGNFELMTLVGNNNERLRLVRLFKDGAIPDRAGELHSLAEDWRRRDLAALADRLDQYLQMRLAHLREIVAFASRRRK